MRSIKGTQMTQSINTLHALRAKSDVFEKRYVNLFRHSPISIWEEDFSEVKAYFDHLKKKGVKSLQKYLAQYPDEVLALAKKVRILDVNEATLKMYQAQSKKEFYQGLNVIFSKESYEVFKKELIALFQGKTEFQSEAANLTLKGEEKHILLKVVVSPGYEDSLANVFVHVIDVSAIRQMETDVRESEEKYRTIVESANDAILVADTETGIILEANQKAGELIGLPADKVVGMHFTQLHPRDEAGYHRKKFQSHVSHGRFVSEKLVICRSNGDKVPVQISSSVIQLRGKKCISAIFRQLPQEEQAMVKDVKKEKPDELTQRECEIVKLIASGQSSREIAEKYCVSESTVKTHRARAMKKLNIHKTADLVRYAVDL